MVRKVKGYICELCGEFYFNEEHAKSCELQCEEKFRRLDTKDRMGS